MKSSDVSPEGRLTAEAAQNRKLIVEWTCNQYIPWDRDYPHYRVAGGSSVNRGNYPAGIKEMKKRMGVLDRRDGPPVPDTASVKPMARTTPGQPSPELAKKVLDELAPHWHNKPTFDKFLNGLATFTDMEVLRVEGHDPKDTETETRVKFRGDGWKSKDIKVKIVNGKAVLPVNGILNTGLTRTTATTCHDMLLLDKDPNAFANDPMPSKRTELEDYLSTRGLGVAVRHFKDEESLRDALKAHGPLVLQTHHSASWDVDEDWYSDRTREHHIVLDRIEDDWADIRDPAWNRSLRVKLEALLRVPEDADLSVESDSYGCYEILEPREAPVTPVPVRNDAPPPMTYAQQAEAIKRLEAQVAEQAATIARLEAMIAQQAGGLPNVKQ